MDNGFILWFRGLSGSGKTSVASKVYDILKSKNKYVEFIDDSQVESRLKTGLTARRDDVSSYIKRLGWIAQLLSRNGVIVLIASDTPLNAPLAEVREEGTDLIEVYLNCSEESSAKRSADKKEEEAVEDQAVFEQPDKADIVLDTDKLSIDQCVEKVIDFITK